MLSDKAFMRSTKNQRLVAAVKKRRDAGFGAPAQTYGARVRLIGGLIEASRRAGSKNIKIMAETSKVYLASFETSIAALADRQKSAARATIILTDLFLAAAIERDAAILDLRDNAPGTFAEMSAETTTLAGFGVGRHPPPPQSPPHLPAAAASHNITAKLLPSPRPTRGVFYDARGLA